MGLFSKKEERYLGIDIGAGGVKLVELLFENGTYKLMTYGYTQRTADAVDVPITDDRSQAVVHVKRLMQEAGVEGKMVIASLPVHTVFSSIIAIPKVRDKQETRALVERQAAKLMPVPVQEVVLDHQVVDEQAPKPAEKKDAEQLKKDRVAMAGLADENVRVLITGARRDMVQTYTKIFQESGLDLESLETEPFALIRSLIGSDKSSIMILDIGSYRSNMIIVERGIPFMTRSIKVGGAMVTRQMAQQLGVSMKEAEQMKYDLATSTLTGSDTPKAVKELFLPIVNEISYAMKLYADSELTDRQQVEKVILTGGSAHLPGLDTFLTEKLNVRTFIGDPWSRVVVNEAMRPVLDDLGPRFAVAIGLAMHAGGRSAEPKQGKAKDGKKSKSGKR